MKHRTGYLFKRGKNWYVQWQVEGKLFSKVLRDANGQSITTRREAEEARDKFMAPMALASEAEALASLASRANALQADLDKQAKALSLAEAWSTYLSSTKRP